MAEVVRTCLLVHGAWQGAWCWEQVVPRLEAAGVKTVTVDNPSVARAPSDLHADADNVMNALDEIRGPVTLVGHSYGGAVITDAGVHDRVERLIYLTAFALDIGESAMVNDLKGGEETNVGDAIGFDGDLAIVRSERAAELFFHDCDPWVAAEAVARLKPMSIPALAGIPRSIAWRRKPSSYIVCTDDHMVPVALQQSNAARTDETFELPTSHSPFLSRPDALAELLIELNSR